MTGINFAEINRAALAQAETLLQVWLPGGKVEGREYSALNPTRNDQKPGSFKINLDNGVWSDFATSDQGSDLISLRAYLDGSSQGEAANKLAVMIGIDANGGNGHMSRPRPISTTKKETWKAVTPIPPDAGNAGPHYKLGLPKRVWTYRNAGGMPVMFICRWDTSDGKEFRPLCFGEDSSGRREWRWAHLLDPRPLYNLDKLAAHPEKQIIITEGEKSCDSAEKLFPEHVVITSSGGSKAAAKTDWGLLRGRTVAIWPDHDKAGQDYAQAVAGLVWRAGAASVKVVPIPSYFPVGWDLADDIPKNGGLAC